MINRLLLIPYKHFIYSYIQSVFNNSELKEKETPWFFTIIKDISYMIIIVYTR